MARLLTIGIVTFLASASAALPAPARAVTLVDSSVRPLGWHQRVADRALVATPPVTVTVLRGVCDVGRSCATPPATVRLSPSDWADRRVLMHELGHIFDYHMSENARMRFLGLLGLPSWRQAPNSPHERFAEMWRLCATRARPYRWQSAGYGIRSRALDRRWYAKVCGLIRGEARAQGWR